jgi:hypothetical protein
VNIDKLLATKNDQDIVDLGVTALQGELERLDAAIARFQEELTTAQALLMQTT